MIPLAHIRQDTCLLLTSGYRDVRSRFTLTLYGVNVQHTPVKVVIDAYRPSFFIPRPTPREHIVRCDERKQLTLKAMENNTPVDCLYFRTYSALQDCADNLRRKGMRAYESDVHPVERYLMERFVKGVFVVEGSAIQQDGMIHYYNPKIRGADAQVPLHVLSLDIENNVQTGMIYSIACAGHDSVVFIQGTGTATDKVKFCEDEKSLLQAFFAHVKQEDPDILIGWNVIDFDLLMIQKRCDYMHIAFDPGRDEQARILEADKHTGRKSSARIPGRAVMDVPVMLRSFGHTYEQYSLDFVAGEVLGKSKLIEQTGRDKIAEIDRQFNEDKASLARYNLEDAQLTLDIFNKTSILRHAIERSKRSGHLIDRSGGSVAAFDYLYLPLLHRAGCVALNTSDITLPTAPLTGGYVMDSKPGLYENVLVLDFKSLYPSIIMTFKIDPLGFVSESARRITTPAATTFARDETILADIIKALMQERSEAKRIKDQYLSYAIKILMNSFYGVLGSTGCRFFSRDLAQSITETGQYVLRETSAFIEELTGFQILYGDTDSLFILLGEGKESEAETIAKRIVDSVNQWLTAVLQERFQVESALELEFETHFRYFLMPTIRGSREGSKKRYCGAVERDGILELTFKGMESSRSDWTVLAKEFQHEIYRRVFTGQPVEKYIQRIVAGVRTGALDKKLMYRKRLRKPLHEYVHNIPPHAQAAKLLDEPPIVVSYFITKAGPQPREKLTVELDYDHYIESQLRPVADTILEWIGLNFDTVSSGQMDLFG
ncbi:MAG: DNA polymerase II [Chitinivibrionales bacterium]|nr:DNA polymerase II [Chitinivibrionales bacterium]